MNDAAKNTNALKLINFIGGQIDSALKLIDDLQFMSYGRSTTSDYEDEELELTNLMLTSNIKTIYISIVALMETMGLAMLAEEFRKEFEHYAKDVCNLEMIPYIGDFESPVVRMFLRYMSPLYAYFGEEPAIQRHADAQLLERMLRGTAKIIFDRGVQPSNEAEVRRCVYDHLIHPFPDTVREVPIAQVTKTYKPDIGIPSLKTAIEYKFAASEDEAKSAIGGLYEDMRGYAGSEDWKVFYAVVYMNEPYFMESQIIKEFEHTQADDNWKPILVVGGGERKPRKKRSAAEN